MIRSRRFEGDDARGDRGLNQFRGVDKALIMQLETLQNRLAEKTHENMAVVERMKVKAEKNASKTLFTAQELAQTRPVRFADQKTNTHVQGA